MVLPLVYIRPGEKLGLRRRVLVSSSFLRGKVRYYGVMVAWLPIISMGATFDLLVLTGTAKSGHRALHHD